MLLPTGFSLAPAKAAEPLPLPEPRCILPFPAYSKRDFPLPLQKEWTNQTAQKESLSAENHSFLPDLFPKEEGQTFPDNTQEFIDRINAEFEYSTQKHPKVVAPLINSDKNDIVKMALEHNIPLEFVRSCYDSGEKHCGKCESCTRLKNALIANNDTYYIKELF